MRARLVPWICLLGLACGSDPIDPADYRAAPAAADLPGPAACLQREPLRRALFGDLHVHTGLSIDAWNYDVELRPRDAYAYAFGELVRLPPNDAAGRGTREVRINRPLDFAAVTDHAEFLGERSLCSDPDSGVHHTETCTDMREASGPTESPGALQAMWPWPWRAAEVCGEDGQRCDRAGRAAWQEIIAAAREWNDTSSACRRTTFIGYEYSSLRLGANLHRNVIFRNNAVPVRPLSYMEVQREAELWRLLRETCIESGTGCDVLAIPHNSNLSNGRMFATDYPGASGREAEAALAALRVALEPIAEIMQHKGDSECRLENAGLLGAPDELCGFEKFERLRHGGDDPGECLDLDLPRLGPGACWSRRDTLRYALALGLAEEERIGVNPFKLGLLASTDTHNALAGGVAEDDFVGHLGIADDEPADRLRESVGMGNVANGPGGLVGVLAEENSREAIFGALRRREVFGTSGPRIEPRFYGGWDLPEDLCTAPDRLVRADRGGVPMGADLPPRGAATAPSFVAFAAADPGPPGRPGGDLQRIQIVKLWVDTQARPHQQVIDAAGGANGAGVDEATCEPRGGGARQLCGVWRDPDFDPTRRAVYYARVVENPSCRWSARQCLALPSADRPTGCAHQIMNAVQQERAWTSPIWYAPEAD